MVRSPRIQTTEAAMLIKNGTVYDAVHRDPFAADIRIAGGKIAEIGQNLAPAGDEEILDAAGLRVYPGLVDAHSHIGLDDYGIGNLE